MKNKKSFIDIEEKFEKETLKALGYKEKYLVYSSMFGASTDIVQYSNLTLLQAEEVEEFWNKRSDGYTYHTIATHKEFEEEKSKYDERAMKFYKNALKENSWKEFQKHKIKYK